MLKQLDAIKETFFGSIIRIYSLLSRALKKRVMFVFLLMVLAGVTELTSILGLTFFFTALNNPDSIIHSRYFLKLCDYLPVLQDVAADPKLVILWSCVVPIILVAIKNFVAAYSAWRSSILSENVAAYIGNKIMKRYLNMPYEWHLSGQSGRAMLAMQRRFNLGQFLLHLLRLYGNLLIVIMLFSGLLFYAPGITITVIIFMALSSFIIYGILRKKINASGIKVAKAQEGESRAFSIATGGIREIIIYQQQDFFHNEIKKKIIEGIKPRSFLGISSAIPSWTLESCGFFLIWFALFFLIFVQHATLAVINMSVALLALTAWRVLPSLNRVVSAIVALKSLKPSVEPCIEYMESLKDVSKNEKTDQDFSIDNSIVFENVDYKYPGNSFNSLENISCTIPIGATVGLIGKSGAGKSTFINILCGLLEPTHGHLIVNGKKLRKQDLSAYRKKIGYVPQSPYLAPGNIYQNIAFSEWGSEPDEGRILKACSEAAIDFLDNNRGKGSVSGLSGGQLQRISIARALYSNPMILIFDEATSSLDQACEHEIQNFITNCKNNKTNIIAAHRLETLLICDFVIWLEKGSIIQYGDPRVILEKYRHSLKLDA